MRTLSALIAAVALAGTATARAQETPPVTPSPQMGTDPYAPANPGVPAGADPYYAMPPPGAAPTDGAIPVSVCTSVDPLYSFTVIPETG